MVDVKLNSLSFTQARTILSHYKRNFQVVTLTLKELITQATLTNIF